MSPPFYAHCSLWSALIRSLYHFNEGKLRKRCGSSLAPPRSSEELQVPAWRWGAAAAPSAPPGTSLAFGGWCRTRCWHLGGSCSGVRVRKRMGRKRMGRKGRERCLHRRWVAVPHRTLFCLSGHRAWATLAPVLTVLLRCITVRNVLCSSFQRRQSAI